MGGFNVNLPGLNFNLTPEAIDAARRAQGLPPLNAAPAPLPPVASPAGDPTIVQSPVQAFAGRPEPMAERPMIGQGVGSFLLNERFGQNIPVEPRIPAQPVPVAAPPPVAAAPPPPPVALPPQAMPQPRDMLGSMALSAPSERFEPIQADLPVQPAPQPPPVMAPPPPPVVEPPPPIIDSEGIPAVITPPPVIAPPPPPPVVAPAPAPAPTPTPTPAVAMRDRLADSTLNQFLGLDERRPMSSETRWGQPVPAQRPRVTSTPPEPTPPAVDEGIVSLTRDAIAGTQYPGLEGFDPANPLNPPVQTTAPTTTPTTAPTTTVPLTGGPPLGYQGGGGEYNPQDGYTDEDRVAEDAFYAEQRRQANQQRLEDRDTTPPPPDLQEPPPEDYTEIDLEDDDDETPPDTGTGEDTGQDIEVYDPSGPEDTDTTPPIDVDTGDDTGLYTPGPVVDAGPVDTTPVPGGVDTFTPEPVFTPEPLPRYRYTPYVPQEFSYVVPEFARNFGPFAGFMPGAFRGGSDVESGTTYTPIEAPVSDMPDGTAPFQPVPTFEVAQPEYVQIQGPSAPVVDPFATPIRPEFAPLPTYERPVYSPRTQKMVDQILSEEEMANPFMNPYLRSGVFGGR